MYVGVCVSVYVCIFVYMCVRGCARVCVCMCVRLCVLFVCMCMLTHVTTLANAGFQLSRYSKDEKTAMSGPQGVVGRPQSEAIRGLHECDSALWCLYPGDAGFCTHGLSQEDLN